MRADDVKTPEDWEAFVAEHGHPPSWSPVRNHNPIPVGVSRGVTTPARSARYEH